MSLVLVTLEERQLAISRLDNKGRDLIPYLHEVNRGPKYIIDASGAGPFFLSDPFMISTTSRPFWMLFTGPYGKREEGAARLVMQSTSAAVARAYTSTGPDNVVEKTHDDFHLALGYQLQLATSLTISTAAGRLFASRRIDSDIILNTLQAIRSYYGADPDYILPEDIYSYDFLRDVAWDPSTFSEEREISDDDYLARRVRQVTGFDANKWDYDSGQQIESPRRNNRNYPDPETLGYKDLYLYLKSGQEDKVAIEHNVTIPNELYGPVTQYFIKIGRDTHVIFCADSEGRTWLGATYISSAVLNSWGVPTKLHTSAYPMTAPAFEHCSDRDIRSGFVNKVGIEIPGNPRYKNISSWLHRVPLISALRRVIGIKES